MTFIPFHLPYVINIRVYHHRKELDTRWKLKNVVLVHFLYFPKPVIEHEPGIRTPRCWSPVITAADPGLSALDPSVNTGLWRGKLLLNSNHFCRYSWRCVVEQSTDLTTNSLYWIHYIIKYTFRYFFMTFQEKYGNGNFIYIALFTTTRVDQCALQ